MSRAWHGGKGDETRRESERGSYGRGYDGIDWSATREAPKPAEPAKVRNGTVADIPDEELLRRAVRNVSRSAGRRPPAWARVMDAFGLGSTYSYQLCQRFGIDPDTGKDIEPLG